MTTKEGPWNSPINIPEPADITAATDLSMRSAEEFNTVGESTGLPNISPGIPERLVASLQRYVKEGIPTGGFLNACLSNDLEQAVATADDGNIHRLRQIMKYIRSEVPVRSWGNSFLVRKWLELHTRRKLREETSAIRTD
jgi:hypothetical protein